MTTPPKAKKSKKKSPTKWSGEERKQQETAVEKTGRTQGGSVSPRKTARSHRSSEVEEKQDRNEKQEHVSKETLSSVKSNAHDKGETTLEKKAEASVLVSEEYDDDNFESVKDSARPADGEVRV